MQNRNKPGFITACLSSYNRFEFNLILIFFLLEGHPTPKATVCNSNVCVVTHE